MEKCTLSISKKMVILQLRYIIEVEFDNGNDSKDFKDALAIILGRCNCYCPQCQWTAKVYYKIPQTRTIDRKLYKRFKSDKELENERRRRARPNSFYAPREFEG